MADAPSIRVGPVRVGHPVASRPPVQTGYDVDDHGSPDQPATLDELGDVDGGGTGVLTRDTPGAVAAFRPISHHHDQPVPVTQWLIAHGLPFTPAGIEVTGALGQRIYPRAIAHTPGQTRLDFAYAVAGTADLS